MRLAAIKENLVEFFRGFSLPFRALAVLVAYPRLLLPVFALAVISLASITGVCVVLWNWMPSDAMNPNGTHSVLSALVFLAILEYGAHVVPLLLCGPLFSVLWQMVEQELDQKGEIQKMSFQVILSRLGAMMLRIAALCAGHALLFVLVAIPRFGVSLWAVAAAMWTVVWLAAQYLHVSTVQQGPPFTVELRITRQHFMLCIGFGTAIACLIWIPFLTCVAVPLAAIGGVLLHREC